MRISHVPRKSSKIGKWGWGWLVFMGVYLVSTKNLSFYLAQTTLLVNFLIFPLLAIYFWQRNRLRKKYSENNLRAGFAAGFVSYAISIILVGLLGYIDNVIMQKDFKAITINVTNKLALIMQDEQKLQESFIKEPKSAADIKYNITNIDKNFIILQRKRELFNSMFKEYKAKLNKSKLHSIEQIQILFEKQIDMHKLSLENLKKYYTSGDDRFYDEYLRTSKDAELMEKERQKMAKGIF